MKLVHLKRVSIIKTVYYNLLLFGLKSPKLLIGKNTMLNLKKNSGLKIKGRFEVSVNCDIKLKTEIKIKANGKLRIDGSAQILNGCYLYVGDNAELIVGDGTSINTNTRVSCSEKIEIGNDCIISFDVIIIDNDFHQIYIDNEPKEISKPIKIGDNVWIGARAIILKGVSIGKNSIIAAGAVVSKDVPDNSLVVGNPMQIVRNNVSWKK